MPGSPTIWTNCPSPSARAVPAPAQEVELLLAPHEGCKRAGAEAPGAARAHDPKERRRLGRAFQRMRAAVLSDEQAGHLTLHPSRDHDRARLGQRLHARGDIGRVAEDFSGRIHHHRPALDADAGHKLRPARAGVLVVELCERALDGQRGANRALGIVLLRPRIAEQRHQPVAELLGDMPAHLRDRLRRGVEVGADQIAPVLGVERGRNGG